MKYDVLSALLLCCHISVVHEQAYTAFVIYLIIEILMYEKDKFKKEKIKTLNVSVPVCKGCKCHT